MFPIGIFSKINKVTTKTLRHYEKVGLLAPEYVDESTRYRYYTSSQIPKLHRIVALKQMGLSLIEIKSVIESEESIKQILIEKEEEILTLIKEEEAKLAKLRHYLNQLEGEFDMADIMIKSLPKVKVASMRQVIKGYDELFELCPHVMGPEMKRLGCICAVPSYCFNIYHDGEYKEFDIDVEICEAVTELKEDTNLLKFKEIEAEKMAACILHHGPYSSLARSYASVFKWIEDNGYEVIDSPRESYIDGIWNKEDESEWLTEIQIPIKNK